MKVKDVIKKYLGIKVLKNVKMIDDMWTPEEEAVFDLTSILNNEAYNICFATNGDNNKLELMLSYEKNQSEPFLHYYNDKFIIDWHP